jgi:transposase
MQQSIFWNVLRTGCQWKMLPKEYDSGSTSHKRFQQCTISKDIKNYGVDCYKYIDPVVGIQRKWQSLDSISVKAPLGGR